MSAFYDNNITDKGRQLMGDIQMGAKFTPTRVVIGSGYLPTGVTTRTITEVVAVVKTLPLNKAQKLTTGDAVFGAAFSNEDVTEAFYYRELGLYAKGVYADGTETAEILYSYGNAGANAELIPAYSTNSIVSRQLDLIVYIGNDAQVELTIQGGVYVDFPTFDAAIAELQENKADVSYVQETFYNVAQDIVRLDEEIGVEAARIDDLIGRADLTNNEFVILRAEMQRIEGKVNENAAKVSSLWDALLTDITANQVIVDFDDLTGFTLTGGVWNSPLYRLEV